VETTFETNMDTQSSLTATPQDACPDWASDMIQKIMLLEVESGTIKNPMEVGGETKWTTAQLEDLAKMASRMDTNSYQDLSAEVEALFSRVAKGLFSEGHSPTTISEMVNRRIPTGCRLPYCSPQEVEDAL